MRINYRMQKLHILIPEEIFTQLIERKLIQDIDSLVINLLQEYLEEDE